MPACASREWPIACGTPPSLPNKRMQPPGASVQGTLDSVQSEISAAAEARSLER
jgi:hypothetical protein